MSNIALGLYKYVDGVNDTPFPSSANQAFLVDWQYGARRMGGAPSITGGTINHTICLDNDWSMDVYVEYKGEKFFPSHKPKSSYSAQSITYEHKVDFYSERLVLDNVYFYDVVSSGDSGGKPVSNSTKFTFFGNITEFIARLNASMQKGNTGYSVVLDPNQANADLEKQIKFDTKYISEALQEGFKAFGIPYYFVGKVCHYGDSQSSAIDNIVFEYGKDNSLMSIEKTNANTKIVNRITGVGSSDNIPYYYPNSCEQGVVDIANLSSSTITELEIFDDMLFAKKVKRDAVLTYNTWSFNVETPIFYLDGKPYTNGKGFTSDEIAQGQALHVVVPFEVKYDGCTDLVMRFSVSPVATIISNISLSPAISGVTPTANNGVVYVNAVNKNIAKGKYQLAFDVNISTFSLILQTFKTESCTIYANGWKDNKDGNFYKDLEEIGIMMTGTASANDNFKQVISKYIPPQSNLMPSIYRNSDGDERFYNAANNTYVNPDTGEYYEFPNPYANGKPKEFIKDYKDVKPTIAGAVNSASEPIDQIIKFAYDANDNDETDEEGNYIHPYFFALLHKTNGTYGFNLFDHTIDEGEMSLSFTSGRMGGCEFVIGVGEDSQKNLVQIALDGNLQPQLDEDGHPILVRDAETGDVICGREGQGTQIPQDWQNDTRRNEVWVALKKDITTYGVIMPNATNNYRPSDDEVNEFVILHIDLPKAYILAAEQSIDNLLISYMAESNTEHWNFGIDFSRIYLKDTPNIANALDENKKIKIRYNGEIYSRYVLGYTYKTLIGEPLPSISIELAESLEGSSSALDTAINEINNMVEQQAQAMIGYQQVARLARGALQASNVEGAGSSTRPIYFDGHEAKTVDGIEVPENIRTQKNVEAMWGVAAYGMASLAMNGGGGQGTVTAINFEGSPEQIYTPSDGLITLPDYPSLDGYATQAWVTNNFAAKAFEGRVTAIESKIPAQASSTNQLADKNFVNSSVATATAEFQGTYDVVDDLGLTASATHAQIQSALLTAVASKQPDNNDYVFVSIPAVSGASGKYERYKFNGTAWAYEYTLNNSSFTAAQWASITSGITSAKVSDYDTHIARTDNPHGVTKAQVGLGNVENTALSTWTGTIKIVTLGTITTGVWHGSAIADDYIASASAWNAKYDKPSGGIPKTDLASAVQTSLGKADTALQSESDPVFTASAAYGITSANINEWNAKQNALAFDGTYDASTNKVATKSTVTNAINALDVSNISGFGAGKTLASLTETDGKIAATFQNISITKSQVSDFPTTWALSNITGADDLKAIEALTGTSGFLKKTDANRWALDTDVASGTALSGVSTRVGTLEGYFTSGVANNAAQLGGQLPSYYAVAADYTKTTDFQSFSIKAGSTTLGTYSPTSALIISLVAGSNISFTPDATNHKLTINNTYSYTLPMASADSRGGIRVGNTLNIDSNGILNANIYDGLDQGYTTYALSAKQGKALKAALDTLKTGLTSKGAHNLPIYLNSNAQAVAIDALSVSGNVESTAGGVAAMGIASLALNGGGGQGTLTQIQVNGVALADTSGVVNITATTGNAAGKIAIAGQQIPVYGLGSFAYLSSLAFTDLSSHPTTLDDYGITDAKIANGVITLGGNSITPLTSHQTLYNLVINNSAGTAQITYKPAVSGTYALTLTKAMVGLSNVENTKLSTWAGSSNITTLGTITTGKWQGTAIADTYIASAATWNAKQDAISDLATIRSNASNGNTAYGYFSNGVLPASKGGTGKTSLTDAGSAIINALGEGSSNAQRDDYIVAQNAGGGTTTTTYHRRKLSNIFAALNSGDITTALGYTPYNATNPNGYTKTETSTTNGKIKINGTDTTVYTHPTTAGNKHIPSGGSSGQFLGYDSAGTAKWVSNPNTDTKVTQTVTTSSNTSWRPLLIGQSYSDASPFAPTTTTDTVYATHLAKFAPKDGLLAIRGLNKMNTDGTLATGSEYKVFNTNGGVSNLAAWAQADSKPSYTYSEVGAAASSHTHGNIQNGGTLQTNDVSIANGDKLVITDASDSAKVARSGITFDASTTNKALTPKGTWESFLQSNQTITLSGDVSGSGTTSISVSIGAGKVTNAMLAGSIANNKLASAGKFTIGSTAIELGTTYTAANFRSYLGLGGAATYGATSSVTDGGTSLVTSGGVYSYVNALLTAAMKIEGETTTAISDGSTTNPVVIGGQSVSAYKGMVVFYGSKEFVWVGTAWKELGDESSFALKTTTVSGTGYLTGGGALSSNQTIDIASSVKTKIDNGATAYGWGNHANAGYALASNLGTASTHAHGDYVTAISWDSTNNKLAWSKGGTAQTAITIGYASSAGSVAWSNVSSRPTKLSQFTDDLGSSPTHTHSQYAIAANLGTASTHAHGDYVTAIGVSGNTLTWSKGGTAQTAITVPYATAAGKLNTNAGSATNPVYFANGVPVACTYSLNKTVPADAVFTDTNTHRPIQLNGTEILGNNTTALNLKAGTNVSLSNSNGTVTIAATDTTYSANNGVGLSGTTFYNSGVRAATINGNYLRINTNGTNADLTIPYATNANYATTAGSAPASDVYAWAKASTKPSYTLSEISSRYQSLIDWGGPNLVGSVSPLEVATIDDLGHNKFAFASAATITIQYSRDGGNTWLDYGAEDAHKRSLLTLSHWFQIGNRTGASNTVNDKLRVILNSNRAGGNIYMGLRRLLLNISTSGSGGCTVKVEHRTIANYNNNVDTWNEIGTYGLSGWSGWNSIPCAVTFGGDSSQTTQNAQVRLTFGVTSVSSTYSNLGVACIRGIGFPLWSSPSNMASTGHLYSYDISQNAAFPAGVSATSFTENGTALSSKYLGINANAVSATKATQDGDGNTISSTYLKLSGGTTALRFNSNNLPQFSGSIPYFLGIEAFASGGTVKWQQASSCSVGYATSAGDADKLDGQHGSYYAVKAASKGSTTKPIYTDANGAFQECNTYAGGTAVTLNGSSKAASTASFYAPTGAGTSGQILKSTAGTPEWINQSALVAGKATILETTRTLWGQNFNGSANVTGDMSNVGNIAFSASGKNIGGTMYFDTTNHRVGINDSTPSCAFDVTGDVQASGGIAAGGILNLAYNGAGTQGTLTQIQVNGRALTDTSGIVNIPLANTTSTGDGAMSHSDKLKLDGIATGATNVNTDTVAGWGYTKNAGTVTGVKMNGSVKGSSGVVDLGTVITDVSGKADKQMNVLVDNNGSATITMTNSTTARYHFVRYPSSSSVTAITLQQATSALTAANCGTAHYELFKNEKSTAITLTLTKYSNSSYYLIAPSKTITIPANSSVELSYIHIAGASSTFYTVVTIGDVMINVS